MDENCAETPMRDHVRAVIEIMEQGARMVLSDIPGDSMMLSMSCSGKTSKAVAGAFAEAQAEIVRLRVALHDAINAPKGVVPQSADPFYRADLAVLMQYKVEPTNTPKMEK